MEAGWDLGAAWDQEGDGLGGSALCADGGPRVETGLFQRGGLRCPGRQCSGLVAGDLDGDGDLDFTVHVNGLQFYLNDGNGGFKGRSAAGGHYSTHLLADWDGDGDLDIVAVLTLDAYGVVVHENRGGVFVERERLLNGAIPVPNRDPLPDTGGADVRYIGVGDLDGKPPIDLIMFAGRELGFRWSGLIFLFRDGVRKRYEWMKDFSSSFTRTEVLDVDRDGTNDVVYAWFNVAALSFGVRGRDWGLVKDKDLLEPWGERFSYLGIADLDRNGLIDVVGFRAAFAPGGEDWVMTARQVAPRAWASTAYCVGQVRGHAGLSDLNGDGAPDVVFSMWEDGRIGVLLNRGDGRFRPLRVADTGGVQITGMVLGDFDGDGRQDILQTEEDPFTSSIVLLRNLGRW